MTEPQSADDRGSSVVDFALITPLLAAVLLAVVQLASWVAQRSAALDAAFAGARAGARTPGTATDRAATAVREVHAALPDRELLPRARVATVAGQEAVVVDVQVPLHLLGVSVPVGPVTSHLLIEPR